MRMKNVAMPRSRMMLAVIALCAAAFVGPAAQALAQSDPFRASAPRAARPPQSGATPRVAPRGRPALAPPAGYVWAIDMRSSCHVMLPAYLANTGFVRWTGRCADGMADGVGTLIFQRGGDEARCSGRMQFGLLDQRERCPSSEL